MRGWLVPSSGPESLAADPAALGLSRAGLGQGAPALGLSLVRPANPAALGLSPAALGSAALCLWMGPLASAPCAHPPGVSCVGPHSANLGARIGASGESAGAASPKFTIQGLRGEGRQRLLLLCRVL